MECPVIFSMSKGYPLGSGRRLHRTYTFTREIIVAYPAIRNDLPLLLGLQRKLTAEQRANVEV